MRMTEDQQRRKLYCELREMKEIHESGKCGRKRLTDCKCREPYNRKLRKYRQLEGKVFEPNRLARVAPPLPGEKRRGRREGRS